MAPVQGWETITAIKIINIALKKKKDSQKEEEGEREKFLDLRSGSGFIKNKIFYIKQYS